MTPIPVPVPMLNANEPEARLVAIHASEGQSVQPGNLLFTIETTKAASDVEAPAGGYLRLIAREGDTLPVGGILAYIVASPEEQPPQPTAPAPASPFQAESTSGLRITKPARALAEQLGLDLASLPTDRLVTEQTIRALSAEAAPAPSAPVAASSAKIILYGAGGHAKAVLEMLQAIGAFPLAGILDDNPALAGTSVLGVPVLGGGDRLAELAGQGICLAANGVGGIINIAVRIRLFERMAALGFAFPALKHPRASVEASARLGEGAQIFANAYVGSSVFLHERCMINTAAVVSHDCEIGEYTHIAPGALLAGHVCVGARALVGMGVTTTIGLQIGADARIGNGAVLLADVPAKAIVPAGKVWQG